MTKYNKLNDTRFGTILSKIIILLLAVFTLYLIYLNFSYSIKNNALIYAIIVIPVLAAVYLVAYGMNIKPLAFVITIFILAFLSKGILALMVDTKPVSDFNTFYQTAIKLLNGDKSFGQTFYFKTFAYQTGPVIYYAAIMKLFGTGLLPLKLVNCFFMAGTNALIYLIARKISNDYTARFIAFLYLLYPAPYFLASVLTNQHFAACMFLLSIYILLTEHLNLVAKGILSGMIMSLGNAVRPLGIVIIGAAIIWGILDSIRQKKYSQTGMVIVLLISYLLINLGISGMVKYTGINPEGLSNNYPLWKFVIGFNSNTSGQFSYADENDIFYIKDFDQRNTVSKQVISQRLSVGPGELANLLDIKQKIMWADFDTMRWAFYQEKGGQMVPPKNLEKYEPDVLRIEKVYYTLAFILMFLGLCISLIKKKVQSGFMLISIILICYFGTHALIEIQVRYRYFAVILVFILAAKGSELLMSGFSGYRKKYPLQYD